VRLFVAVWPPDAVVRSLSGLRRPAQAGVRWTTSDQWHVTLRFLGSIDDIGGVKDVLARFPPEAGLTAVAGPGVQRLGRAILCLPVGGLEALAGAVLAVTADIGEPAEDRAFKGHITLARAKPGVDIRPLAGETLAATWRVDEVTLVASDTRPDGARYQVLARVPLR
jgi:RNA 2',3'-cyclic 3'-phosphodiesterase